MVAIIDSFSGQNRFLSNFYPSPILFDGSYVPTVEHAYQALKSTNHTDAVFVARSTSPGEAKRRGRIIKVRPDWEEVKIDIMAGLLTAKFSNPSLREMLKATDQAFLIEGNTWGDTFWGAVKRNNRWVGLNWLGRLLMIERGRA